ncbi:MULTISPECIES: OmpA/MotB family protein [Caldanaerobacter]|jgi:chemotaxis protein MotB|uniref:Chemotaxis protein MotB n=1 Tax=Caldanaerobacter subterraneus TaxID=911092 RepID=A0A4R2KM64_9THEO|nr:MULTISPECIES: flagellar motor protein MotB [Caldanaerobacter]MDI3519421.1 chemotaxis protein MotB [Caldanaerobacter sp.]TCO67645.1 chemotaxis protein MotB [Caldanaerobacter subterraneus]
MKRLEEDESKPNKDRWVLTYSDMMSLLLVFFVVLYSISTVNATRFAQLAQILSKTLGGTKYVIGEYSGESMVPGNLGDENELAKVQEQLNALIEKHNLQKMVTSRIDERGLVISLQDTLLFDLGSAEVRPEEKEVLIKIGSILKDLPNYIRVEGFTDDIPINNQKFASNWELSVIRATNVLKILVNEVGIEPQRISAAGYGEYRPIVPNDSEEHRRLNRRVDIVIMNTEYNKWEPKGQ